MVTRITVTFSDLVTLNPGAFDVLQQGGGAEGLLVSTTTGNGHTVATITFTGSDIICGSLADGRYSLQIHGDRILGSLGQRLDGDGDGRAGGDREDQFFRLFGDGNGDGKVDNYDLALFRSTFGRHRGDAGYLDYFDWNGDGVIDRDVDYAQFTRRYGHHV